MLDKPNLIAMLDSLKEPILFADIEHITRYMNKAAINHYTGGEELIGQSLLECHNGRSQEVMKEVLNLMINEQLEEREIGEDGGKRIFMRVVRDPQGSVLGYYERYEPILEK